MGNSLNINPNRMELMKLSKRLSLAKRGHRLLKDKQDELMDRFTAFTQQVKILRSSIEAEYEQLKKPYMMIKTQSDPGEFNKLSKSSPVQLRMLSSHMNIMNISVPAIDADPVFDQAVLGVMNLSAGVPGFIVRFKDMLVEILRLINAETAMYAVAQELQKVRRRVNALEYIFIPKLEETIDYISMQLEEMDRETIARLMKIKDIVRKAR